MNTETLDQNMNAEANVMTDAKIDQWERKLLDLSLRNGLLNMRLKGNMIPLFAHSPALLEDKLAEDIDFTIKPRTEEKPAKTEEEKKEEPIAEETAPAEEVTPSEEAASVPEETAPAPETPKEETKQTIPVREYDFENISDITGFDKLITEGFDKKILYSSQTKAELSESIKKLYRSAKVSLEENGANTLYIALGVMKWFDKDSSVPHYAPLILIPVDLVRKSIILGYVVRRRDEEPIINITLLEKLKQDFGIVSDPKEIFVSDDSGIDVDKVIENFRMLMTGQDNWEIYNSCVIGMFSFTNFVMWNDLHARRDQIGENKIVKSLLEGRVCWDAHDMVVPDKLDESDCLLPITADSSQLYAIKCATGGESFVLHGPPGTGKSQTITSMIADMLAHGKTVLFAAEKKAALDVVYSRLDKIGLGPFCLELHSNKAKKSAFLDKLKEAVELRKKTGDGDYDKALKELADRRHELDKYCAALHNVQKCGNSLYELINIYEVNSAAPDVADFDEHFMDVVDGDTMKVCENSLESVISAGNALGDVSYLASVRTSEYSQQLRNDLPGYAQELKTATQSLERSVADARAALSGSGVTIPGIDEDTFLSVRKIVELAHALLDTNDIPAKICASEDPDIIIREINGYQAEKKNCTELENKLFEFYKPEILKADIVSLTSELQEANSKTLFKSMAVNKVFRKVESYRLPAAKADDMMEHFGLARDINEKRGNCDRMYSDRLVSYFDRAMLDDGAGIGALTAKMTEAFGRLGEFDRTGSLRKMFAGNPTYMNTWQNVSDTYAVFDDKHDVLEESIGIKAVHDSETFGSIYGMCDDLVNNIDHLRDRVMLNQALGVARSHGLVNVVNAYMAGELAGADVTRSFRKAYSKLLIGKTIDSDETLRNFSGKIFEDRVEQYKKLNDDFMALTRQEIYLRVASSLPDLAKEAQKDSALGILQRAIKNGGRGVSIRTLFSKIPHLISKLCPCMLMSPISVAQYLEPGVLKYDMVLFDEASQLPTCKAVGVIARAENAIIVGDPNQMPPTSFFQSSNYDEENYEIEDLESILDDCLALSMPGTHLLWHYRSKHESLITYSNRAFYDNRLYTFPSSNDLERKVTFVSVDGVFDRGRTRTNKAEAEKVVDEIIRRITSDPNKSIGVVTFNISQQNLIDDMLAERLKSSPEIEEALYGSEEPIFIKNLENVQGDERDVILFSVGYGTDEEGKVYMNFGPLSQDGGWRRLNVAVTRSRYEMMVFSSLQPEQIKVTSDTARGVAAFRSFLEYAQGRAVWENSASPVSTDAPVIDRFSHYTGVVDGICAALVAEGFKTTKGVGSSEYKIDIGVIDPEDENRYCLGILMDGKFYLENKTTSGREIYQRNVLSGLGWNTMRVWTLDWWENKDRVIESIIAKINEILEARKKALEEHEEEAPEVAEPLEASTPGTDDAVPDEQTSEQSVEQSEVTEPAIEVDETKKSNPQEAPAGENT